MRIQMNEELYKNLKVMTDAGFATSMIKGVSGASEATIGRVKQSKDWAGYQHIIHEIHNHKPKTEEVSKENRIEPFKPVLPNMDLLILGELKQINANLEQLVNKRRFL